MAETGLDGNVVAVWLRYVTLAGIVLAPRLDGPATPNCQRVPPASADQAGQRTTRARHQGHLEGYLGLGRLVGGIPRLARLNRDRAGGAEGQVAAVTQNGRTAQHGKGHRQARAGRCRQRHVVCDQLVARIGEVDRLRRPQRCETFRVAVRQPGVVPGPGAQVVGRERRQPAHGMRVRPHAGPVRRARVGQGRRRVRAPAETSQREGVQSVVRHLAPRQCRRVGHVRGRQGQRLGCTVVGKSVQVFGRSVGERIDHYAAVDRNRRGSRSDHDLGEALALDRRADAAQRHVRDVGPAGAQSVSRDRDLLRRPGRRIGRAHVTDAARHVVAAVGLGQRSRPVTHVPPDDDAAVGLQAETAANSHPDGHEVTVRGRNVGLSPGAVTPGNDRAVRLQAKAEVLTRRHRHEVAVRLRHVRLAVDIASPGNDRAVVLQTKRMVVSAGRGDETPVWRRHIALAVVVAAEGDNRSVGLDPEAEPGSTCCEHEVRVGIRNDVLSVLIVAPGREGGIRPHGQEMVVAGAHMHEVRTRRLVAHGPIKVAPPGAERAVRPQSRAVVGARYDLHVVTVGALHVAEAAGRLTASPRDDVSGHFQRHSMFPPGVEKPIAALAGTLEVTHVEVLRHR